jgi:hypothetical protein
MCLSLQWSFCDFLHPVNTYEEEKTSWGMAGMLFIEGATKPRGHGTTEFGERGGILTWI